MMPFWFSGTGILTAIWICRIFSRETLTALMSSTIDRYSSFSVASVSLRQMDNVSENLAVGYESPECCCTTLQ
uniref:Secreted protein n=1 Tax=Solanum tuberosum TaxID=4113 RepID=M1B4V2_SOLTU